MRSESRSSVICHLDCAHSNIAWTIVRSHEMNGRINQFFQKSGNLTDFFFRRK